MSTATGGRWRVETWDPAYGASTGEQLEPRRSQVEPTLDVELAEARWRPLDPGADARTWRRVLFVDGVRRIDAIAWDGEEPGPDGIPSMALFASYAAGVVCCDPGGARLLAAQVHRGLFSGATAVGDVATSVGRYVGSRVPLRLGSPPPAQQLTQAVQARMRTAEAAVSETARHGPAPDGTNGAGTNGAGTNGAGHAGGPAGDDLLVVDGPLHGRTHLPRTLGYAKTHDTYYLPAALHRMVGTLGPGQRTPVFGLADRYSWYLKLPGGPGAPWAGVVRVECSAELAVADAVATAGGSQRMLGRYASTEYKDARAPQNLYPIAGLERELRRRLGDRALTYRAIRAATA
ncbi:MAG TPA: hypothetical protein VGH99_20445 [Pseudonocardia sp.]